MCGGGAHPYDYRTEIKKVTRRASKEAQGCKFSWPLHLSLPGTHLACPLAHRRFACGRAPCLTCRLDCVPVPFWVEWQQQPISSCFRRASSSLIRPRWARARVQGMDIKERVRQHLGDGPSRLAPPLRLLPPLPPLYLPAPCDLRRPSLPEGGVVAPPSLTRRMRGGC